MGSWGSAQIFFNLLFNSTCSFVAGILMVYLTFKLFRIGTSRWRLAFLTLPFLKILWDMHLGIPKTSFLYHGIDPLTTLPKHKTLTLGLGFEDYHPVVNAVLAVDDEAKHRYSISVADFIWALLRRFNAHAPQVLLYSLMTVSCILVAKRIFEMVRFELRRKQAFSDLTRAQLIDTKKIGYRSVRIFASILFSGTPFTGGVIRPYICIPAENVDLLSRAELDAVIGHELAHIKYLDLVINVFIQLLGDVFWFVPGYRFISRKIDRLREILADDVAVQAGASPVHLASALLKVKSAELTSDGNILYSAFFKDRSVLKERIERLTDKPTTELSARFGWSYPKLRWVIALVMALTVFSANIGGNYEVKPLPDWLTKWFDRHGWHVE